MGVSRVAMEEVYVRLGSNLEPQLERVGMAILKDQFKAAAYVLLRAATPAYRAQALSEALGFVRGSGLEHVISTFGLEVDAGQLRETFFTWASHRKTHHGVAQGTS